MTLKRQTLSVCLIVKNEESCLGDCLASVRPVADQIVVVDTGSTDRTVAIAREHGAEVYSFRWIDDFSAARNTSISYATGDWILWLDADETLMEKSQKELLSLLREEKSPVIYGVQIKNIKRDGTYSLSGAHRLFNNFKGIYFFGRIHEQVSPSVVRLGGVERESNIVLYHTGYNYSGGKAAAKNERNRNLLLQQVEENPKSAYAHYTLAQHLAINRDYDKALGHYERAVALKQFDKKMTVSLYNTYSETLFALGKYQEAKKYIRKSLSLQPVQAAGYYLQYKLALKDQQPEKAVLYLKKLLRVTRQLKGQKKRVSTDILIPDEKIKFTLAGLYSDLGNAPNAIDLYEELLQKRPNHREIINRLIHLYQETNNLTALEKVLTSAGTSILEDESYTELLGITRIKQEKFQQALPLFENLYTQNPKNDRIKKILIGLYGKTGNIERAQALL